MRAYWSFARCAFARGLAYRFNLLLSANNQAVGGVLYSGDQAKKNAANVIFTGINELGDIN